MRNLVAGLIIASTLSLMPKAQAADAKAGETLFNGRGCVACHGIGPGAGPTSGPNLKGVTRRHPQEWIARWIKNPDAMRKDPAIAKLSKHYPSDMPNMGLSDEEVQSVLLYLKSNDK
jgi:mono/diheme cytochrome c family protein